MADKEKDQSQDKDQDENKEKDLELEEVDSGGSKKLLVIIIAVVLLAAGAGAYFLLGGEDEETDENEEEVEEEVVVEIKDPPQYIGVPEAITSNIFGIKRNRTIQIKMSFMVRSDEAKDLVKTHMPQLKNDILMLISQQSADELKTPEGRIALQQKSLEVVQKTLTELSGKPTIEKVLFVSFAMQ